ncbi:MAG: murein biosynthesis integral membrane protein MurJ [Sulfurospirillaceae bacterium]|nr:murein biosynthesis integral membrane protein MurJ [Sulfurospirillaceae bacterium]
MKNRTSLTTGFFIILLILLGKIIAFAKNIAISTFFGAGSDTDAFFIALNITSILFVAFYSTVSLVFLPLYNEQKIKYGFKASSLFGSNIINIYLLIAFLLMSLSIVFAPEIVHSIDLSNNHERVSLTITLLRVMTLSFIFSIFVSFMTAIQFSNEQYLMPHLVPIINNMIVVLAIIFLAPKYGIFVPAIAGVVSWILQVPFHKWIVKRMFHYSFYLDFKDARIKNMSVLFFPAFLGIFIDQANLMVDTMLASGLSEGSVSAINYSSRLISFSSGIFVMAIMSIMFPKFSKHIINSEQAKLNQLIQTGIRILLLIMLPIMAIILVYNYEIVSIVFQRGKFSELATKATSSVFLFYGIGIIFLGLRELFNKVFYAQKNTKIPLFISFIAVSVNIVLSIIFARSIGVRGLALASSISLMVYVILQVVILKNKIGKDFYNGILAYIGQLVFAISLSTYIMWKYKEYAYFKHDYLIFITGSFIGMLTYVLILLFLKNEEIYFLYYKMKSKLQKRI